MVLSGAEISRLVSAFPEPMISGFNEKNVRGSSYDLTVGSEYYLGDEAELSNQPLSGIKLEPLQTFTIPAHGICYVLCSEGLFLPGDITAKVSLRMKCIYGGLILPAQPPFDPGYKGKVIVMVHNLSSADFPLKQGDRVATIEFLRVLNPASSAPHQPGVIDLKSQLTRRTSSSLSKINAVAEKALSKVNYFITAAVTVVPIFFAVITALPAVNYYNTLNDKIVDYKGWAEELKTENKEQEKKISDLESNLKRQQSTIDEYVRIVKEQGLQVARFGKAVSQIESTAPEEAKVTPERPSMGVSSN
jgi:deoxycytidine triphosphate deaminase